MLYQAAVCLARILSTLGAWPQWNTLQVSDIGGPAPISQKQGGSVPQNGDHQTLLHSLSVRLTLISKMVLRGSHLGDIKTAGPGLCSPLVS